MKFTAALIATLSATTSAFVATNNNGRNVALTELYARQPIMAGNWKVRVSLCRIF